MWIPNQTIYCIADNSLWLFSAFLKDGVQLIDEVGDTYSFKTIKDFTHIKDEFDCPITGKSDGKLPDSSLKIYLFMTEEEKESRCKLFIDKIMEKVYEGMHEIDKKAEIDRFNNNWWPSYNLCRAFPEDFFISSRHYAIIWNKLKEKSEFSGRFFYKTFYCIDGKLYVQDQYHILARVILKQDEIDSIEKLSKWASIK